MEIIKRKISEINKENIYSITFKNKNNYSVTFYNFGGYIHKVLIPHKKNNSITEDVLLGYNDFKGCQIADGYFNAIIGRVCNRINNSKFKLKNKEYNLYSNSSPHHLHGGKEGFNKKIWKIEKIYKTEKFLKCTMKYLSSHLEENYPGNLICKVVYLLNNENEFSIFFEAITDKDTIVNMTNHNYWNFHGHNNTYQNITNHSVLLNADNICEIDESYIPTGLIKTVKENKFDMNNFYNISQSFLEEGGIDHNYILKYANLQKPDGIIFSNITGMGVEYFTDQPGMQFYTGNMMDTSIKGKYGKNYGKNFGMCFEPQIYPDAINHPNFPSPIIKSGETYRSKIIMKLRNNFL